MRATGIVISRFAASWSKRRILITQNGHPGHWFRHRDQPQLASSATCFWGLRPRRCAGRRPWWCQLAASKAQPRFARTRTSSSRVAQIGTTSSRPSRCSSDFRD